MSGVVVTLLLKYVGPVIVAVLGWLGVRSYYMRQGAAKVRAEQAAAEQRANRIGEEVQNDVRAMSPEQVEAELRKRARK